MDPKQPEKKPHFRFFLLSSFLIPDTFPDTILQNFGSWAPFSCWNCEACTVMTGQISPIFFFFFFCIYRWAPLQSNTPKSKLVFIRSDLTLLYISHVLICALNSKFAYFRLFSEKMNFFRNRFLPITWWKDNDFHFTSVNPGWLIFFWNVIAAETFADMLLCLSFQEWLQEVKNIGGGVQNHRLIVLHQLIFCSQGVNQMTSGFSR